jgi:membrane dipeptidase
LWKVAQNRTIQAGEITMITRRHFLQWSSSAALSTLLPRIPHAQIALPLIIDAHIDLGWNLINAGYDYTQSAYTLRESTTTQVMVGLPELLAGRVALGVGTIYVMPNRFVQSPYQIANYSTPDEAHGWGLAMIEAMETLVDSNSQFRMVSSQADLDAVLESWEQPVPQVGIMIAMEGADPITDPDELQMWWDRGVRMIGLSWGQTRYAGSSSEPGPLTDLGAQLLAEMQRLNMMFDTAHLAEQAFWQALDIWQGPLVYTHGIPRYFLPTERALSDDQIRAIVERDGVVGIGVYSGFYQQHLSGALPALADMVNAIDYVCQISGSSAHAGIGSDADGGFDATEAVTGIDTVADLHYLTDALTQKGYTTNDIRAIMAGNWQRILYRVLGS